MIYRIAPNSPNTAAAHVAGVPSRGPWTIPRVEGVVLHYAMQNNRRRTTAAEQPPSIERQEELMPEFTIIRQIEAPVEKVWEVLEEFGSISKWNADVKRSSLTSEGSTRHCDFSPLGGVEERIDKFVPNERMTVILFDTSKLPISGGVADFKLAGQDDSTELTINYSYTLNRLGRMAKGTTDKQLRKGINGLADSLSQESVRITAT
jgi:uncharacterized protein YndB with AHSA1/START domain